MSNVPFATPTVEPLTELRRHPVNVEVTPATEHRNRLTTAFRPILAIPHLLLVGGPVAFALSVVWQTSDTPRVEWGAGTGVLGAVAAVCALIAWFAILFTGEYPVGLRSLVTVYLRWRVRAIAYIALLRDEYPPFGDDEYPAQLRLDPNPANRNRLTVAFRAILALPHIIVLWLLGFAWGFATLVAWVSILFTGRYPVPLYRFAVGMLRWNARLEAYLLLLHDQYPPFSAH